MLQRHSYLKRRRNRIRSISQAEHAHWAYRPVRETELPEVADVYAVDQPIDRFILSRLQTANLQPQPEAARTVLARRLYFDLLGLPPTPDEIESFANDDAADAYERLVDRLLASPALANRWGRHWLDLVRSAESLTLRGLLLPGSTASSR